MMKRSEFVGFLGLLFFLTLPYTQAGERISSMCRSRITSTSLLAQSNHQIYLLNIQPVIPFHMTEDWNLITRVTTPVINLPSLAPGIGSATCLGDINPTFFLSAAKSGELIWGVGQL